MLHRSGTEHSTLRPIDGSFGRSLLVRPYSSRTGDTESHVPYVIECNTCTIQKLPFGVNIKTELKNIRTTSENANTLLSQNTPHWVPLVSDVVVMFLSYPDIAEQVSDSCLYWMTVIKMGCCSKPGKSVRVVMMNILPRCSPQGKVVGRQTRRTCRLQSLHHNIIVIETDTHTNTLVSQ